jgi:AraC-like DNA-binding protein
MIITSVPSPGASGIPHDVFDAHTLPAHERFEVWRESVLPLFEPRLEGDSADGFYARVDGFNLQQRLFICLAEFSGQRYVRSSRYHADESADHLLIQLYLTGGYVGHNGHRTVRVGPGDISLLDLGFSLETLAESSSAVTLVVPREVMFSLLRPEHLDIGCVIEANSAVGRILGNHLTSVWRALRSASAEEGERISQTLLGAVAGAFAGRRAEFCEPASDVSTLEAIRAYIESNLSADLTLEHLRRRFDCSRARLSRMFQPLGGLAAYIRSARLERCHRDLSHPCATGSTVSEIAMRWGFRNQSHFRKLFRAQFGVSPGEVMERARDRRQAQAASGMRLSAPYPTFRGWLRQL